MIQVNRIYLIFNRLVTKKFLVDTSDVCSNTKSDVIIITEDKLRLIFGKFVNRIKKTRDWISYAGISVTILLSLLTCNFDKDFLGVSHDIWYAVFVFGFISSAIMLIVSVINCLRSRNLTDKMIIEIKNEKAD
jgi:hypothetical protein